MIAVDDVDRCAAETVVTLLEAVHLLFNFEMFVVVLAATLVVLTPDAGGRHIGTRRATGEVRP